MPARPPCPAPEQWRDSQAFRYAVDLFNYGFYWESHEVWESLWHATGRHGTMADFLKALIKLAAAGVKAREGRAAGWRRHIARALELLADTQQRIPLDTRRYFGLDLGELIAALSNAEQSGPPAEAASPAAVRIVFPFRLLPE